MATAGEATRRWLASWPVLLRIDVRRPASWVGLVMAGAAAGEGGPVTAMTIAALATIAAVGEVPRPCGPYVIPAWFAARAAWPVVGVALGGVAHGVSGGTATLAIVVLPALLAVLASAVMLGGHRPNASSAADAATSTLIVTSLAWAAGVATGSVVVAICLWGGGAAAWLVWLRFGAVVEESLPRSGGDMVVGLVSPTAARRFLGRAAMTTMLVAMAWWLLLDPARAGWGMLLGMAWIVCLATPAALLSGGATDQAGSAWNGLLRSAAGQRAGLGGAGGRMRTAAQILVRHALVLGWPAVVAAAVTVGLPAGPGPALAVAAAMALTAGAIMVLGIAVLGGGGSGETAFATVLLAVVGALHLLPLATQLDSARFFSSFPIRPA